MTRNFRELLEAKWAEGKFVCVGLDTDWQKIPESVLGGTSAESMAEFNYNIIEATKDIVCCYKPNIAFYEDRGTPGLMSLQATMELLQDLAPNVPVNIDAKRGDIGTTNLGYVHWLFDDLEADAITVHNYMGMEAMRPFLDRKNKGIFVLCKTSNPGSGEFQNLEVSVTNEMLNQVNGEHVDHHEQSNDRISERMPLYQWVARRVASRHGWNYNGNCGLVAGGTYSQEIAAIRALAPDVPILCPGIGKQGGDLASTVKAARDSHHRGFLINSSSGIIFASRGVDYAAAARVETIKLHDQIRQELSVLV